MATDGTSAPPHGAVPRAGAPSRWHVSPAVDTLAYHLSWAWILIPLAFVGDDQHVDYRLLFALVLGLNFAHRHFGLPYTSTARCSPSTAGAWSACRWCCSRCSPRPRGSWTATRPAPTAGP